MNKYLKPNPIKEICAILEFEPEACGKKTKQQSLVQEMVAQNRKLGHVAILRVKVKMPS